MDKLILSLTIGGGETSINIYTCTYLCVVCTAAAGEGVGWQTVRRKRVKSESLSDDLAFPEQTVGLTERWS